MDTKTTTPPVATARQLHDFLEAEGIGQDKLAVINGLPPDATAEQGLAALQGHGLSHGYLYRAMQFVKSNGKPPPAPRTAWDGARVAPDVEVHTPMARKSKPRR